MAVGIILFLQSLKNPLFDFFSNIIRSMGESVFSAIIILIFYWCIDKKIGRKLAFVILSGSLLCNGIKNIFRVERPFINHAEIIPQNLEGATGYSFPSGHTQNGATTSMALALYTKKKWFYAAAVLFGVLVGLSRMYHGVHTIYDVTGGLVFGIAWAYFGGKLYDYTLKKVGLLYYIIRLMPAVFSLIGFLPFWQPRPVQYGDTIMLLGLYLGMMLGFAIEEKYICFELGGSWKWRFLQVSIGIIVVGLIFLLFNFIPSNFGVRFIKYFIFALWAAAGQPFVSKIFQGKGA